MLLVIYQKVKTNNIKVDIVVYKFRKLEVVVGLLLGHDEAFAFVWQGLSIRNIKKKKYFL
jgi:hypothetical protein